METRRTRTKLPEDAFYHIFEMNLDGTRRAAAHARPLRRLRRPLPAQRRDRVPLDAQGQCAPVHGKASAAATDAGRPARQLRALRRRQLPAGARLHAARDGRRRRATCGRSRPSRTSSGRPRWPTTAASSTPAGTTSTASTATSSASGRPTRRHQRAAGLRQLHGPAAGACSRPGRSPTRTSWSSRPRPTTRSPAARWSCWTGPRGTEDERPLTRLTPEVCFPETEGWPTRYYASPWPLSEEHFLVAWATSRCRRTRRCSVDDPRNPANAIGHLPVRRLRQPEPAVPRPGDLQRRTRSPSRRGPSRRSIADLVATGTAPQEGRFLVQDVYEGLGGVARGSSQAAADRGRAAQGPAAHEHPGAGRVGARTRASSCWARCRWRPDGSAYFRVPSGMPFLPGPGPRRAGRADHAVADLRAARTDAVLHRLPRVARLRAAGRPHAAGRCRGNRRASTPGPDGSWPLRYDQLVQPVLDRHCVSCHRPDAQDADGGQVRPDGRRVVRRACCTTRGDDLQKLAFEKDFSDRGRHARAPEQAAGAC